MKAAVYVMGVNGTWRIWVSLAMEVDWWWHQMTWAKRDNTAEAKQIVTIASNLPLGWAVKLRERFESTQEMGSWGCKEWRVHTLKLLQQEIKCEADEGKAIVEGWGGEISIWSVEGGRWRCKSDDRQAGRNIETTVSVTEEISGNRVRSNGFLMEHSDQLLQAVYGRSLLASELEALLTEQCPELSGHWRSIVQLLHLQGRLVLDAAVGEAARLGLARRAWRQHPSGAGVPRAAARWLPHPGLRRRFASRRALPRCRRCGSGATGRTPCAACGLSGCAYCEACLALGRSRACALLVRSAPLPAVRCTAGPDPTVAARRWGLSAAQAEAAGAALGFLAERRQRSASPGPERFLLWAVTGAGKTEMIFPLLEAALGAGGRALVASPRRDVVLELAPRLARAFPGERLAVLYGGSAERWSDARLILATTHQLLRFYHSFDLVIIDELDAFPKITFHTRLIVDDIRNFCWNKAAFPSMNFF